MFVVPPIPQTGESSLDIFSTFPGVVEIPSGKHDLDVNVLVSSNTFGTAEINLLSIDALTVNYITAEIGNLTTSVEGRFPGT